LKDSGKFVPSQKVLDLRKKLIKFMDEHVYSFETEFYKLAHSDKRWTIHPEEERLKDLAKKEGLWNLFIPVRFILVLLFIHEKIDYCDIIFHISSRRNIKEGFNTLLFNCLFSYVRLELTPM
jgi:hypothetical protein